jgi:hypothetical protein
VGGKAKLNLDYTLNPAAGVVVIPAGESSANIILSALVDTRNRERSEKATLTLNAGSGYTVSGVGNKATVTILAGPHHR